MHLYESWMKKHGEAQLTLGFSCNFSQSECNTHVPHGNILHIFSSLYRLPFYYTFISILMHWVVVVFVFKLLAKLFLLPIKIPVAKQGEVDCSVIPGAHKSFRSLGCFPLLVMIAAIATKTKPHQDKLYNRASHQL